MSTIRRRGDSWQAIIRIKKAGVLVHSESQSFTTERLAKAWADRVEKRIRDSGVPARIRDSITFGDLIDKYRVQRDRFKPLGRSMHGDLDLLKAKLGKARLDALTADLFSDFARGRRSPNTGPATVMHNLAIARTVLNSAKPMFGLDVDTGAIAAAIQNLQLTGVVARPAMRMRRPSKDELDALEREFKRIWDYPSTKIPMHLIVPLAVALPRRLGELCDMRWEHYANRTITLIDTKHPRVPRRETVPVPAEARDIIDGLPKLDERILPYKSESCSAAFDRATSRLGIEDLHFHDLRHEGISRLFERGLGIPQVALISGHLSWQNLKRYTHLTAGDVLEKLDGR